MYVCIKYSRSYSVAYPKGRLLTFLTQEKCRRISRCLGESDGAGAHISCNSSGYVRFNSIDDSGLRDSICDLPPIKDCVISCTWETKSSISKGPRA